MRVAIATDRDFVATHFGCSPLFTIADIEDGRICHSLLVPNPGCNHAFWVDLFVRNAVTHVIAGRVGDTAMSVFTGRGLQVITGVQGDITDVVQRLHRGELRASTGTPAHESACGCSG
jgi:predicted Fe-Mo cluster-binding NifX family protein